MCHRIQMGVPDDMEGPPRKRPKLSLRGKRSPDCTSDFASGTPVPLPPLTEESEITGFATSSHVGSGSTETFDLTAGSPSAPDPLVAPVASLHNLGNTCFMNSMLQVLRYTPAFLSGLDALKEEIAALEEEMDKHEDEDEENSVSSDTRRTWRVVKNIHSMYLEMDEKEYQYRKMPTSDTSRMAVRPNTLLNSIRELNPMFEGNFQHDAQELLRCLLCYMEDADRSVRDLKRKCDAQEFQAEEKFASAEPPEKTVEPVSSESKGSVKEGYDVLVISDSEEPLVISDSKVAGESLKDVKKDGEPKSECGPLKRGRGRPRKQLKLKGGASSNKVAKRNAAEVRENGSVESFRGSCDIGESLNCDGKVQGQTPGRSDTQDVVQNSKVSRGRKRKRSKSISSDRQTDEGGGDTDRPCRGAAKSNPTAPSFKKCAAGKVKKQDEKEQTIVSLFKKIKDKLVPNSKQSLSPETEITREQKEKKPSSESGIMSMLPFKQIRRMGMNGYVFRQPKPTVTDLKSKEVCALKNGAKVQSEIDDTTLVVGDAIDSDSHSEDIEEETTEKLGSSAANNSNSSLKPVERCDPQLDKTASPSSRCLLSPAKSPHSVEVSNEITLASETDATLDMESAIDSVTRKYYSSLSRPGLSHVSPTHSSWEFTSPSTCARNGYGSMDLPSGSVDDMQLKPSFSPTCSKRSPPPASHCPLTPGKDVIIHSPDKSERPSRAGPRKQSSAVKVLKFENDAGCPLSTPEPAAPTVLSPGPIASPSSLTSRSAADVLDFLPKRVRQVTESQSLAELRDSLLHLDDTSCVATRSSRSAPNSPRPKNVCDVLPAAKPAALVKTSHVPALVKPPNSDASVSVNNSGALRQVKVELKRCDWLGVSPVKSVSASKALKGLQYRQQAWPPARGNVFGAKVNILHKLNAEASSASSNSGQNASKVSNPVKVEKADPASSKEGCLTSSVETCGDVVLRTRRSRGKSYSRTLNQQATPAHSSSAKRTSRNACRDLTESDSFTNAFRTGSATCSLISSSAMPSDDGDNKPDVKVENISAKSKSSQGVACCPSGLKGLKLKPLSVAVDKCDFLLAASPSQTSVTVRSSRRPPPSLLANHRVMVNGKVKVRRSNAKTQVASKVTTDSSLPGLKTVETPPFGTEDASKLTSPLVERLFGGTMMHVTRCLECECNRERKEVFLDISVAVKQLKDGENSDSGAEDDGDPATLSPPPSCLASLVRSSSSVERLRDSNKYWCEQCLHHVEAERSCHYVDLPRVLSLHLKRFSAGSGLFGGVSKLNDKVSIPEELPCLRHQCGNHCQNPSHRYCLFAIATHSGTSILHGHYRAYVKVQPWVRAGVFHNLLASQCGGGNDNNTGAGGDTGGADQTSSFSSAYPSFNSGHKPGVSAENALLVGDVKSEDSFSEGKFDSSMSAPNSSGDWARGSCPIRDWLRLSPRRADQGSNGEGRLPSDCKSVHGSSDDTTFPHTRKASSLTCSTTYTNASARGRLTPSTIKTEPCDNGSVKYTGGLPGRLKGEVGCDDKYGSYSSGRHLGKETVREAGDWSADSAGPSCFWLECDDECVRVMEEEEFGQKLREEDSALLGTPYVLFYHSQAMAPS